jgi:hypothetical protein
MADLITGIDAATQGKLDAAIRKINTAWLNPQQMFEQTLTGQIAYFDYQAGDKIEYWMRLSPFREQAKSLTGTRDFGESGKVKMAEIGFSRWDLYSEFIPISSTSDPYKIFLQFTEGATNYFTRFPLRRVVRLLQQNGTSIFDGLPFYSNAHVIDPTTKKLGTFSNDLSFKISETGWAALKDAIMQIQAPNSYLANTTMGKPEIWVPSDAMHIKFAKLFGVGNGGAPGTFQAKEITAGQTAASESITVTSTAVIRTVPELLSGRDIDNPSVVLDPQAANRYYLFLNNSTVDRPVVVRMPRPMTVKRSSGGPDDVNVQNNNSLAAWSDCEAGFGYGAPQKGFRILDA